MHFAPRHHLITSENVAAIPTGRDASRAEEVLPPAYSPSGTSYADLAGAAGIFAGAVALLIIGIHVVRAFL